MFQNMCVLKYVAIGTIFMILYQNSAVCCYTILLSLFNWCHTIVALILRHDQTIGLSKHLMFLD